MRNLQRAAKIGMHHASSAIFRFQQEREDQGVKGRQKNGDGIVNDDTDGMQTKYCSD